MTWDLGSVGGTDTKAACDFAIFSRADLLTSLVSGEIDLKLKGSSDNFSASDVTILSEDNIETGDLIGTNSQEFLLTGAESTKYRYWRLDLASTSTYTYELSKFVFGTWFNFGNRGPIYPYGTTITDDRSQFTADSGTIYRSVSGKVRNEYTFQWEVTDSVRDEFKNDVMRVARHSLVWLYTPDADFRNPLNGETLVPCWIDSVDIRSVGPVKDKNILSVRFIEDVI